MNNNVNDRKNPEKKNNNNKNFLIFIFNSKGNVNNKRNFI